MVPQHQGWPPLPLTLNYQTHLIKSSIRSLITFLLLFLQSVPSLQASQQTTGSSSTAGSLLGLPPTGEFFARCRLCVFLPHGDSFSFSFVAFISSFFWGFRPGFAQFPFSFLCRGSLFSVKSASRIKTSANGVIALRWKRKPVRHMNKELPQRFARFIQHFESI